MDGSLAIRASCIRLLKQLSRRPDPPTLGAAGGLLVAYWWSHALVLLFPARSGSGDVLPGEIDWRVMSLSAGICLIATLIVGLVPCFKRATSTLRRPESGVLGCGRGREGHGCARAWSFPGLSELYFAGLERHCCCKAAKDSNYDPGFSSDNVVQTGCLDSAGTTWRTPRFSGGLIVASGRLPGVESAAFAA